MYDMEQLLLSTKIWNRHFICALLKRKKKKINLTLKEDCKSNLIHCSYPFTGGVLRHHPALGIFQCQVHFYK